MHSIKIMAVLVCLPLVLGACQTPDQYQGNGVWVRDDGTTYQAAEPIAVSGVNLVDSHVREQTRLMTNESTNEFGEIIIREYEHVELEVDASIEIALEDGSSHFLNFTCRGHEGHTVRRRGSFTAPNKRIYTVNLAFTFRRSGTVVSVSVWAPGPVSFSHTLKII